MEFEIEVTRSVQMTRTFKVNARGQREAIDKALDESVRVTEPEYGRIVEKIDRVSAIESIINDPATERMITCAREAHV